ncbi:hypothetical protein ACQRXC_29185 (plasmid) [Niallia taxi]
MKQDLKKIVYGIGVVLLMVWGLNNYSQVENGIDTFVAFMATWTDLR